MTNFKLFTVAGAAVFAILACGQHASFAKQTEVENWEYVSDGDSNSISQQTILLSEQIPKGIEVEADFGADRVRYGIMQFGSTQSRYLTLALVESDKGSDLYIDLNRDQKFATSENVNGRGGSWDLELQAEFPSVGESRRKHQTLRVRIRPNRFGDSLRFATLGYVAGQLNFELASKDPEKSADNDLGGKGRSVSFAARIADANNNGRFGDPMDLLWVDLDSDGKFDDFSEKLACKKGLQIDGNRYQLVGDEQAIRFKMRQIEGNGKAEIALDSGLQVLVADLLLVGKDGTSVAIQLSDGQSASLESLPVGEYRIASFSLAALDPIEQEKWHYSFSGYRTGENVRWFSVEKGKTTKIEPLHGLRFRIGLENQVGHHRPGEILRVVPKLTTSAGLVINNCWQGEQGIAWIQAGAGASIELSGTNLEHEIIVGSGFK